MFYYIVLGALLFGSIYEVLVNKPTIQIWKVCFWVLTFMLLFRWGQGSDYFGYMKNYYVEDAHSEIGFILLQKLFLLCRMPFEVFVMCISAFLMFCTYRFLGRLEHYQTVALALMYHTIFLTYYYSAIRQGIVMAVFLAFLLPWMKEKRWGRYYIVCVLLILIHSAALVLLLLPILMRFSVKKTFCVLGVALGVGGLILFMPVEIFRNVEIGAFNYYITEIDVSILGILERCCLFLLISCLWFCLDEVAKQETEMLIKIYIYGFCISVSFFRWSLVSSRLAANFKAVEILLIPILLYYHKRVRKYVMLFVVAYVSVMMVKNLRYAATSEIYDGMNFKYLPYCTVFDKHGMDETIIFRVYDLEEEEILKYYKVSGTMLGQ